ncbi:hypothetical protein [Neomegalonema sp.]|uniref:hypothetical protein n=1 Tax=Neomegalonema sp. TaxID=2039713 RepID=UPI00260D83AB|nr:hypothetical protein [Neomegalonema sp.]MDD2869556.1 hypothetical protein [Neomegalonema sp.]
MAAPETSPKLLKANRTRILLLTLGSFAFVVGSLLLPDATPAEQLLKYGGAAFFLLCGAAAASHLLPGRSGLSIDAEGMELSDGFKGRRRIAFADIAEKGFFVYSMKGASMVIWAYREGAQPQSLWRRANKALSGGDDYLPVNYEGHSAKEMAELLNAHLAAWRRKAAAQETA